MANRLSEVPEWKVLLLEAGAPETPITQIPALSGYLQTTPYSWHFHTVPQNTSCLGMIEHRCHLPASRALGGETAINNMLFTRGNPRDYDLWADLGNEGWCHNDVFPIFKHIEDAFIKNPDKKMHRYGGPVHLESPYHVDELAKVFIEAAHEIGLKEVDYNGKQQIGVGLPQKISKAGQRNSVAKAYLEPAHKRHNLVIRPLSYAVKILVSQHTKEATGVKYVHEEHLYVAKARKEIIVAAGAINTPKLLKLSGIGPIEELEHLEIPPVVDLHVGNNLRTRTAYIGLNFYFSESKPVEEVQLHELLVEYLKSGEGKLTSNGIKALAYIHTPHSKIPDYPDIELLLSTNIYNHGVEYLRHLGFDKEIYEHVWKPLEGHHGFTVQVILNHPKSKGNVFLHDKDPYHPPLIDLNQLSDEDDHDIETILAGIHTVLKLAETEPFKKLGIKLNEHPVPKCAEYKFGTDEYWKCSIRYLAISVGDLTGTARMGPITDKYAVVDHQLKVHGVHNLRVADASVIPVPITGHVMGATIMVGEKAAEIIKEHWH